SLQRLGGGRPLWLSGTRCRRRQWRCSFFFKAEDGIRYIGVTGVQTCALPISQVVRRRVLRHEQQAHPGRPELRLADGGDRKSVVSGKSLDLSGRRIIKKK